MLAFNQSQSKINKDSSMGSLTLLLVEDNPLLQKVTSHMLTSLGYTVKVAGDGKSALVACLNQRFDLIFMDMGLPDMNGISVTQSIRRLAYRNTDTPIVALTTQNRETIMPLGKEVGLNDHQQKPASPNDLKNLVDHWCHTH